MRKKGRKGKKERGNNNKKNVFKRRIVKVSEGIREQRPRRENKKYEGMDGRWREKNKNINRR